MKCGKFINYSHYIDYRMASTIQLSNETKRLIASFGTKEDTYEDIIKKMYKMAVNEQLRQFLMSSDDSISLEISLIAFLSDSPFAGNPASMVSTPA